MGEWDEKPGTLKGFPSPALTIGGDKEILFWNGGAPELYLDGLLPALATPGRQVFLYERQQPTGGKRVETPNLHFRSLEDPIRHERPVAFVTTSPVPILRRASINVILLHTPDLPQEQVSFYDLLVFTSKYARHAFLAANTLFDEARTIVIPMGHFASETTEPASRQARTNTVIYVDNPQNGIEDSFEHQIWPAVKERVPDASLVKVHPDESFLSFTESRHIFRTAKCICYLARYQATATALLITAQAEGVVPIVRKSGALPESVGAGVIYNNDSLESRALMIDKICVLLSGGEEWESLSASTAVGVRRHRDWKSIAERWATALKL